MYWSNSWTGQVKLFKCIEKIDNLEATSVDFYATIRSLYLERRNRMIRNQSADKQDPFKDFDLDLPLINDFE